MAIYAWYLQGLLPTTIEATDILQFAGLTFGSGVFVGNYQDSMHVKSSLGVNDSSGNTPHNSKYIDADGVSLNGAAETAVSAASTAACPLKINFSHPTSVAITSHVIYAYDGLATTSPPTGVTFKMAEQGDAAWATPAGSAAALAVGDKAAATSHDFYFLVSATPTSVGLKNSFRIRDELIYS